MLLFSIFSVLLFIANIVKIMNGAIQLSKELVFYMECLFSLIEKETKGTQGRVRFDVCSFIYQFPSSVEAHTHLTDCRWLTEIIGRYPFGRLYRQVNIKHV